MKLFFCVVFCSLTVSVLQAQRFGGNPLSLKWQQANSDAARVIFPKGLDSSALRVAAVENAISKATLYTIGQHQQKINIVLHPNTTVSNGYVALGPFRSEFYLTPAQSSFELGSLRWQDMLASHEYRHVQQYNNFNVGLSHAFCIVFGQQGQELANALAIPNWFWEGDAVFQETLVTPQGRGRLPFFYDDYRSLWLAGKNYSYMKLRNGSLRDFTPDHYRLGYMMVAYGREKYGDTIWRSITHDAAAFKGLFYPFQKAVKKYTGKSFTDFRTDAMDYFKAQSATEQPATAKHKHFLADQEFPVYTTDEHSIIYVKTSYKKLVSFIEKTGDEERLIRVRDLSTDNQFSYNNGKIVYASYRPAVRWAWNDYNELQVLDVSSGVQKTITRRTKYFSPSFSPNGESIVAVDVQPGRQSILHLLNTANGAVEKVLPNPDSLFYTYPKYVNEKQLVAAVRKMSGSMALALINTTDGATEYLTPFVYRVMGNPAVQHDTIYFTAADNGYDRLFAFTLSDKKLYQLSIPTNGIGAYQPAVTSNRIMFTSFTAEGYRLQDAPASSFGWNAVSSERWLQPISNFKIDFSRKSAAGLLATVPAEAHITPQKYPALYHLFNFHSLLPYLQDPDYQLSLVGNNILNTMSSEVYVGYNRNEQYKQVGTNLTYGGLFPYLNLGASYIFDRRAFRDINHPVYWNEGQVNGGLSVPLNLSKGRSIINLTMGTDYVFKNVMFTGLYKDTFASYHLGYINSYVSFTHQIQQARQHIYPRFAQSIYINYRDAVEARTARQFLAVGNFYFPGLAQSHNIVIGLAYQNRDTLNQYYYSNSFPFSRGYESPNLRSMYKWSANYHLPLLYPDWGFGNIVYFQRIRLNAFYDYTMGNVRYRNGYFDTKFRSTGGEMFFDTKWWNELPVTFGIRYSHLLDADLFGGTGSERIEFVLPVNLFQR